MQTSEGRPLVSIIVAVYNGERFLNEALESLFDQDYEPLECVLVDDGSEDRSAEIAKAFPVRYTYQENQGVAAAFNAAIARARGKLIGFLGADDVLPPTKVSQQAGYLGDHPNIGCVLGRQEVLLDGVAPPPWLKRDPIFGDLGGVQLGSAMIRKRVLQEVGGFDVSYRHASDRDLFVRMREHGVEIAVLPDVVLYRRVHGDNMTNARSGSPPVLRSLKEKLDRSRAESALAPEETA